MAYSTLACMHTFRHMRMHGPTQQQHADFTWSMPVLPCPRARTHEACTARNPPTPPCWTHARTHTHPPAHTHTHTLYPYLHMQEGVKKEDATASPTGPAGTTQHPPQPSQQQQQQPSQPPRPRTVLEEAAAACSAAAQQRIKQYMQQQQHYQSQGGANRNGLALKGPGPPPGAPRTIKCFHAGVRWGVHLSPDALQTRGDLATTLNDLFAGEILSCGRGEMLSVLFVDVEGQGVEFPPLRDGVRESASKWKAMVGKAVRVYVMR